MTLIFYTMSFNNFISAMFSSDESINDEAQDCTKSLCKSIASVTLPWKNKRIKHAPFQQGGDPVNSVSYHSL